MAYTRQEFALELKEKIQKKVSIKSISEWALRLYQAHSKEIDYDFKDFLSDLHEMNNDIEHQYSLEKLDFIADRFLAGELAIDLYNKRDLRIQLRKKFGLRLKEKVQQREDVVLIGRWAWQVYSEYICDIDDDFASFLTDLNALEDGPEFELSYEELDQVADKLIKER